MSWTIEPQQFLLSSRGGRAWWAHFEFTRINTTPTILYKKIEDFRQLGAFVFRAGGVGKRYGVWTKPLARRTLRVRRARPTE